MVLSQRRSLSFTAADYSLLLSSSAGNIQILCPTVNILRTSLISSTVHCDQLTDVLASVTLVKTYSSWLRSLISFLNFFLWKKTVSTASLHTLGCKGKSLQAILIKRVLRAARLCWGLLCTWLMLAADSLLGRRWEGEADREPGSAPHSRLFPISPLWATA